MSDERTVGKKRAVDIVFALAPVLGYGDERLAKVTEMVGERAEAIAALRKICTAYGDNDWDDDASLADVIEKHLGRHLDGRPAKRKRGPSA